MTRILVVTNLYPPHHYGGYELSCRDVVDRWRSRHDVLVLTSNVRVPGAAEVDGERRDLVRRDLRLYWDDHVLLDPPLRHRFAIERSNQRHLTDALRDFDPDVVSIWNMGAMSTGLLTTLVETGTPLVYNVCDDWLDYAPRVDAWMRLFLHRPVLAAVARSVTSLPTSLPDIGSSGTFCFVSDRTRRFAEHHTRWRFPDATIVYSGVDYRDFEPLTAVPPVEPWSWRLLCVGRTDPRKGFDTVLRAVALLPEQASLSIVGPGDAAHLRQLHALARELGIDSRVAFDAVPRSELRERYMAADAFVFPSVWDEPFGLVPLEAMACGTPVVATDRGGAAEFLLDGHNCVQFAAGDPHALAQALLRVADDQSLRTRIVDGGLATARQLSVDRLAAVTEEWHVAAATNFDRGRPPHRPALATPPHGG